MSKEYYVYEWIRLDTNEPFYVGKGKGDRWRKLKREGNNHFNNIVNKVSVAVNILHDNLEEEIALGLEVYYIWLYRDIIGYMLVNINDGGDGCALCGKNNPMYGKNSWDYMDEDAKIERIKKLKERKGEKNPWYGRSHTLEAREKMSKTRKGKTNGKNNPKAKSVICLTTTKIFSTEKEGSEYYNCVRQHISKCCKGERNYCGKLSDGTKLRWMYLKDFLEKCEYILL